MQKDVNQVAFTRRRPGRRATRHDSRHLGDDAQGVSDASLARTPLTAARRSATSRSGRGQAEACEEYLAKGQRVGGHGGGPSPPLLSSYLAAWRSPQRSANGSLRYLRVPTR